MFDSEEMDEGKSRDENLLSQIKAQYGDPIIEFERRPKRRLTLEEKEEVVRKEKEKQKMAEEKISEDEREDLRKKALATLDNPVYLSLAAANWIEDNNYGDKVGDAIDEYIYDPNLKKFDSIDALRKSRRKGKRYTGSIDETAILEDASDKILKESMPYLKVNDIAERIGYEGDLKGYEGKWMSDLLTSEDGKDKEFAQLMVSLYVSKVSDSKVKEAFAAREKSYGKGLEEILERSK